MRASLSRGLGLPMLTFYGIGMILGAGVYSIIGKAAGVARDSLWQGFLLAALSAFLTALSYAELATMYPKAGAEYYYLKNAFRGAKGVAAAVGIMMFFAGSATASTVSLAFAGYLEHFIAVPAPLAAVVILVAFTLLNISGIRASGWFNIVFTLAEIGGLVLFVALGLSSEKFGESLAAVPTFDTLSSAALIVFAYFGFENIVNLSEETKHPERTVPRAIILSFVVSTVLYLLVSLAALALASPERLAGSSAPLVDAAAAHSRTVVTVLGIAALFSTANTALIALVTTSRILFGISKDGSLPAFFSRTLTERKTPWVAACAALAVSLLLLPLGAVEAVASVSALATLSVFLAVHGALIVLRFREPDRKRPFRVPLAIGPLPLLPCAGSLICAVFLFQFSPKIYLVGGVCFALSVLLGFLTSGDGAFRKSKPR